MLQRLLHLVKCRDVGQTGNAFNYVTIKRPHFKRNSMMTYKHQTLVALVETTEGIPLDLLLQMQLNQ